MQSEPSNNSSIMDEEPPVGHSSLNRPYRSKRHRPCDVCRRRKHACHLKDRPPCGVCRELGTECTFNHPPTKRSRQSRLPVSATLSSSTGSEREREPTAMTIARDDEDDAIVSEVGSIEALAEPMPDTSVLGNAELHSLSRHDVWYAAAGLSNTDLDAFEGIADVNFGQDTLFPLVEPVNNHNNNNNNSNNNNNNNTNHNTNNNSNSNSNINNNSNQFETNLYPASSVELPPSRTINVQAQTTSSKQALRTLDPPNQSLTAQVFGPSGEMDPYLLQHMQFPEDGTLNLGQFQYRSLLSPHPASDAHSAYPVHFMVSAPKDTSGRGKDAATLMDQGTRKELEKMIDAELGARLVGLFLRYIFPSFPILSRSRLNVKTEALVPKSSVLDGIPTYLLAAIYAAADTFRHYDPILNVAQTDMPSQRSKLWDMAYQGIMSCIHVPQIAVLQTLLIYLQRPTGEKATTASTDNPSYWSLLGLVTNMANQLGLHLDCRPWPIPEWEKRLRRRLWWVLHSEATWRSLLLGLPLAIHADQWHVGPLSEADFVIDDFRCPDEETAAQAPAFQKPCTFCHLGHDFRFLADLSLVAYDLYLDFFTLRATKTLSSDLNASLHLGKRYVARLDEWHDNLPSQVRVTSVSNPDDRDYFHPGSAAHVKLAFLTLKALTYRVILRPVAKRQQSSSQPPHGYGHQSDEVAAGSSPLLDGSALSPAYADMAMAVFHDAVAMLQQAIQFVQRLGSYDRNSFSRSWSRACFATISNLVLLLLVISPTATSAKMVLGCLARWVISLREQSVMFDNMQLGLLRLDAVFRVGLEKAFRLPSHVIESIQREMSIPM